MVTWGTDQVRHFNTASTAQAAPSPSFSFGTPGAAAASPALAPPGAGFFGTPAPGPATGSIFGTPATAPAPTFGFPSNPPATSGFGLFGSPPASAAPTSFFGAPSPATTTPQPQQQPPQTPALAALQAHQDASARNEEARVLQRMQVIYNAFTTGGNVAANEASHCFSTTLYNPVTQQERQFQMAYSSAMGRNGIDSISGSTSNSSNLEQLFVPPKPPQINESDWHEACVRNPDSFNFMPVAVVGADSLKARAILQQSRADAIVKEIAKLTEVADVLKERKADVRRQIEAMKKKDELLRVRLLKALKHVEMLRCLHQPLHVAEMNAYGRLLQLSRQVVEGELAPAISRVVKQPTMVTSTITSTIQAALQAHGDKALPTDEQQERWKSIVSEQRTSIVQMTEAVRADQHDLQLIQDRIAAKGVLSQRHSNLLRM